MGGDLNQARFLLVTVTVLTVHSWCAIAQPTASAPAATQPSASVRVVSPHWSDRGCRRCHQASGDRLLPISLDSVNELCWRCHDGKRATAEVHPVGRLFTGDQVERPRDWPAPGGKLSCITCHDVRMACDHPTPRPTTNPSFLRPVTGQGLMAFCAACHVAAFRPGGGRLNVHVMLDAQGRPVAGKCRYCHQDSFEPGASSARTGEPQLRGDGISLCIACHPSHVDHFEPGHIGYQVSEAMRARMLAAERVLWRSKPLAPQSRPATSPLTRLPLEKENRIVCATCHNPHQQGTFPEESVLSDGAIARQGERRQMRLRGLNKDLCHACHE